jgi:hypothetical protein
VILPSFLSTVPTDKLRIGWEVIDSIVSYSILGVRAQAVTNGRVSSGEHREDVGGDVRHAGDGVHGGARAGVVHFLNRQSCVAISLGRRVSW